MKKALLSSSLIFVFIAYVLYVRILGTGAPALLTPQSYKSSASLSLPQYNNTIATSSPKSNTAAVKTSTNSSSAHSNVSSVASAGKYKDGSYVGNVVDAYYGNVQVKAIVSGGKITDVQFLDYPQDRQNSIRINSYAIPRLVSEAISIQDSNVNTISGASFTSEAYRESLSSALLQARA